MITPLNSFLKQLNQLFSNSHNGFIHGCGHFPVEFGRFWLYLDNEGVKRYNVIKIIDHDGQRRPCVRNFIPDIFSFENTCTTPGLILIDAESIIKRWEGLNRIISDV